jgi:predicted flap endonuclease-1-like 5' DNA nuclease
MNITIALVLGLLIGWLVEWIIDWFFWRRRFSAQDQALQTAQSAEAEARSQAAKLKTQVTELEERVQAAESMSFSVQAYPSEPPTIANRPDDLTQIKGIGPVIAAKLNAAGIMTFQQLSRLSSEEFEGLLGDLIERFVNEKSILDQARDLSEKK